MNALLEAALRYAPRTVPLEPRSKTPVLKDWPNWQATREAITEWWTRRPRDNVGVRTGGTLAIIDIDPRAGGDDNLADLEHEHGELPATVTVHSGGEDGGRHLYYRCPKGLSTFTLATGVQVRALAKTGAPQQCAAPPSIHPETGRPYAFAEGLAIGQAQVAELPGWVYADNRPGEWHSKPAAEWARQLRGPLPPGDRHPTLIALAGHLLARHIDPLVTLELVAAFNEARCRPPKPADEIAELVDWVAGRELLKRRGASP